MRFMALCLALLGVVSAHTETRTLSRERYLDKLQGAWAGQMFGVCFGEPWEFRSNGAMITKDLGPWKPEQIACAIKQDDCYVEMTFLKALQDHGLDITPAQAGAAFGASEYPLWHANLHGRNNIRRGILPPDSGHPRHNLHADDIDFQIEADLFGILCPGLPQASNQLCDVFGHIMNYGDGVYGGMFVSGMYAAAYFEDKDILKVVHAGLACIPTASTYHQCISDVIAWHAEHPDDWAAAWQKIEAKWQDDNDCMPGNTFNIDAKLNGAYIVMGLLYGDGDPLKTAEVSVRCGQDADCNPSNAAGILGCMKGLSGMDPSLMSGIPAMAEIPFDHTAYSFNSLIAACDAVTQDLIRKNGGTVDAKTLTIPVQAPRAPDTLEQWDPADKKIQSAAVIAPSDIDFWMKGFALVACGHDMEPGLLEEHKGQKNVLALHPISETAPAVVRGKVSIDPAKPVLQLQAASFERGDYVLAIVADGKSVYHEVIDTKGAWKSVEVSLAAFAGTTIDLEIQNVANGWAFEAAYLTQPHLAAK